MLDHGGALGISGDEWLTIGERRNEVRPRIGFDSDAQTVIIRLRGTDLGAFRAGQSPARTHSSASRCECSRIRRMRACARGLFLAQ